MTDTRRLEQFLLAESRKCIRPPVSRFAHPWIAPMPLSETGASFLRAHGADVAAGSGKNATDQKQSTGGSGPLDVFNTGDYSLGLFHHDASEAAIELLEHAEFLEPCRGALLNLLDNMRPDGFVRRVELVSKSHEDEPSKPVLAQMALRCAQAADWHEGAGKGVAWLKDNDVYGRIERFLRFLEVAYGGMHGLIKAHSALQTGFDNDLLTVALPDNTVEDPGINAFMVLEYRAMGELAGLLGRPASETQAWSSRADRIAYLMNELMWWECPEGSQASGCGGKLLPGEGFYCALRWKHGVAQLAGEVVGDHAGNDTEPLCSWVSLLPLYAGIAPPARAQKIIRMLTRPDAFWGPMGVRTAPADSKYFNQAPRSMIFDYKVMKRTVVSNWQGPVWVLSSYYMAAALDRYGRRDLAADLTARTLALCAKGLESQGSLHECYDDTGKGLWPAEGGFISWNVLALTMARRWGRAESSK